MKLPFRPIIVPGVGFGDIKFGNRVTEVVSLLRLPTEQYSDEDGDLIVECDAVGVILLSFSREESFRLVSYELDKRSQAELWNLRIFTVSLSQMMHTAKMRGLRLEHVESPRENESDETLYRIKAQSLDFYYLDQQLTAVSAGVIFHDPETILWP